MIAVATSTKTKTKTKTKVVLLNTASVTISAGRSKTIQIPLNRAGKRLLLRHHELQTKLTITQSADRHSTVVLIKTVTFKATPTKKHGR